MPKRAAIFDYDHTLITGDSFMPFLAAVGGRVRLYATLIAGLFFLTLQRIQGNAQDHRHFLKDYLLKKILAGRARDSFQQAAIKTRLWQKENPPVMQSLREHADRGDIIVIASGGLNLYLPELLRGTPYHFLICTDIGMDKDIATGEMINGNCVRLVKAERVAQWLAANGPFDEIHAYGNAPHDLPMLDHATHKNII